MKKADYIIIAMALCFAGFLFYQNTLMETVTEGQVNVYFEDQLKVSYDLNVDGEYTVKTDYGTNIIQIKDKKVQILEADCRDQVCVRSIPINREGQVIVCLPHKVFVEVKGEKGDDIDVLSN